MYTLFDIFFFCKGEGIPIFINSNLLGLILSVPLFSIFFIFFTAGMPVKFHYLFSLYSTVFSFLLSFFLWYVYDSTLGGFQFNAEYRLVPSLPFNFRFGVDGISIFFILLTNIFIYLSILTLNTETSKLKEVILHLMFLQWTVSAAFVFLDILGFFIFFEMTLIPIYFLVLIWGSRERRIRASYLISIYTLLGSIFLFFNLLYIFSKTGTTDYQLLMTLIFTEEDQKFLWLTFFISFAAKIPLFPLHIWLPEAHVEAPTLGSVLLAVLLLKLGTYGLIRFSLPLFPAGTLFFGPLASTFAILGILYTCLIAIRQIDLKKIIAYSSVGHMNVVLLGILSETSEGIQGAIFQMLSHGVVSGALFFAVGSIYERYSVRSLKYFGGLTYFYPLFSLVFLIFSMANISFPLTSSFVGEFLIFMGLFQQSFWATFFASTSMVLGAVYTLWTYNRIFFGNLKTLFLISYKDLDRKETYLFSILIFLLFTMGIFSYLFLDTFLLDTLNLVEKINLEKIFKIYPNGIHWKPMPLVMLHENEVPISKPQSIWDIEENISKSIGKNNNSTDNISSISQSIDQNSNSTENISSISQPIDQNNNSTNNISSSKPANTSDIVPENPKGKNTDSSIPNNKEAIQEPKKHGCMQKYYLEDGSVVTVYDGHKDFVLKCLLTPDGREILFCEWRDGSVTYALEQGVENGLEAWYVHGRDSSFMIVEKNRGWITVTMEWKDGDDVRIEKLTMSVEDFERYSKKSS